VSRVRGEERASEATLDDAALVDIVVMYGSIVKSGSAVLLLGSFPTAGTDTWQPVLSSNDTLRLYYI